METLRPRAAIAPFYAGGPLAAHLWAAVGTLGKNEQQSKPGSAEQGSVAWLVACPPPLQSAHIAHVVDARTGRVVLRFGGENASAESKDVQKSDDVVDGDDLDLLTGVVSDKGDQESTGMSAFEERSEQLTSIAFSQDGTEIICGVLAGVPLIQRFSVQFNSEKCGKLLSTWRGHTGPVGALVGDASGSLYASSGAGADQSVRVWQVTAKLANSSSGTNASGSSAGEVSSSGYCTHHLTGHGRGGARVLAFHPDPASALLFAASNDGEIRAWNLLSRQCVLLKEHYADVAALCFSPRRLSPSSKVIFDLVSVGRDRVACVWNVSVESATAPITRERTFAIAEEASGACSFADGSIAVVGADSGRLRMFDVGSGAEVATPTASVSTSATAPGSAMIGTSVIALLQHPAACMLEGSTQFCAVNVDSHILVLEHDPVQPGVFVERKLLVGTNDEVIDVKFIEPRTSSASSPEFIAVTTNSNDARVFSLKTGSSALLRGHSDTTLCVDTAPSGRLLFTGSKDNSIRAWRRSDPVAAAADSAPLWLAAGTALGHTEAVSSLACARKNPDWFISASADRTLKIWSYEPSTAGALVMICSGTVLAHDKDINHVCVAPNDAFVASSSQDKTTKIWAVKQVGKKKTRGAALELHGVLRGHRRGVWSAAFSPVDQVLVTASSDKTLRLWRVGDLSCLKTFQGHETGVLSVAFLSLGTQLFSASADGLSKLWNIKTGDCANTFDGGHTDRVWALAVPRSSQLRSPDQQKQREPGSIFADVVLSAGSDGLIQMWDDVTAALSERHRMRAEQHVLQEQELENALRKKEWDKAIRVAFALDQPARLLKICEAAIHAPPPTGTADDRVDEFYGEALLRNVVMHPLFSSKLPRALGYIREWNANSRSAHTAQVVLRAVLDSYPPETLAVVPKIQELMEGLIPYSQRHFARVSSLVQQTFLLDFLCEQIRLTAPERSRKFKAAPARNKEPLLGQSVNEFGNVSSDDDEEDQVLLLEAPGPTEEQDAPKESAHNNKKRRRSSGETELDSKLKKNEAESISKKSKGKGETSSKQKKGKGEASSKKKKGKAGASAKNKTDKAGALLKNKKSSKRQRT